MYGKHCILNQNISFKAQNEQVNVYSQKVYLIKFLKTTAQKLRIKLFLKFITQISN